LFRDGLSAGEAPPEAFPIMVSDLVAEDIDSFQDITVAEN
jgi:hypothetical protein